MPAKPETVDALRRALDLIAEAKSEEPDAFTMGVLAGAEDAIEDALQVIAVLRS